MQDDGHIDRAPGPDAEPASGGRAAARRARTAQQRKARKGRRILKYAALGTAGIVLVTAGGGYFYVQYLNSRIHKGDLNNGKAHAAAAQPDAFGRTPLNILVLGSDGRDSDKDCKLGGACDNSPPHADVEMLLHVSADRSNASVISIPRDTRVMISSCKDDKGVVHPAHEDIITDSLNYGGPGCVVDTWEDLTHIHIDHYMMVDFAGVVTMADAVGGVPVCVKENVSDNYTYRDTDGKLHEQGSHLVLPAGTHKVTGVPALEWLRTRHAWGVDAATTGTDVGRTKAQHLYLNSMVRQMKSLNTLLNPVTLNKLATAATGALHVDNGLGSVNSLINLAKTLNKVPTNRITMVTMPWEYDPENNAHVIPTADAATVFRMIQDDVALDKHGKPARKPDAAASAAAAAIAAVDRASVPLTVQNSGNTPGRAGQLTTYLQGQGYAKAVLDSTRPPLGPTALHYPTADKVQAQAVAKTLGLPAKTLKGDATGSSLVLDVGTDWTAGTAFPAASAAEPGALPTSAMSQNAFDDAKDCMEVNPAPYKSFAPGQTHYLYSWTGSTPPKP